MPRGDKSSYSSRQKRKAAHIEEGYERRGVSKKTAVKRAMGDRQQAGRRRREETQHAQERREEGPQGRDEEHGPQDRCAEGRAQDDAREDATQAREPLILFRRSRSD